MGPNQGPGFIQEYTDAIRRFRIDDDGVDLSIADHTEVLDTMELHRRDYNMLPQRFPNGELGYTIFSGVFQHNNNIPWLNTVDVRAADWNVVPVFEQLLNQYHTARVALWDSTMNRMDNVFFGGMSRYHYTGANLTEDTNVPFVDTISRVSRDANGAMTEFAIGACPGFWARVRSSFLCPPLYSRGSGSFCSDLLNRRQRSHRAHRGGHPKHRCEHLLHQQRNAERCRSACIRGVVGGSIPLTLQPPPVR